MGRRIPVTAFADDHQHVTQVREAQQVQKIMEVYKDFAKVSGLHASVEKTVMLEINTDPGMVEEITQLTGIQTVEQFRYLGIQLGKTYEISKAASYQAVQDNIRARYLRINSSHVDLFHRRQLIRPSADHHAILQSCFYGIWAL